MNEAEAIYANIPGGPELLAWFGYAPNFHDAEIVNLELHRRGASRLSIHFWHTSNELDARGYFVRDRHAVVIFTLEDVLDLQLDSFSNQNVIGCLSLRRAQDRRDRRLSYAGDPSPEDWEIELEPCYGLHGTIRCRRVSIGVITGEPNDLGE